MAIRPGSTSKRIRKAGTDGRPENFDEWPREIQLEFDRQLAAIKSRETPLLWEEVELGIAGVKGVARPKQLAPDHPKHSLTDANGYKCMSPHGPDGTCPDWEIWLFLAGRGTGKTKAGAQWTLKMAREEPGIWVGVCAPTFADIKNVCFEGQALALDTYVPTPDGAAFMGDLRPGDTVFGGDGAPCRVTEAFNVLTGRDCYRVTFKGGAQVIADADHKWLVQPYLTRVSNRRGGNRQPIVLTTKEMIPSVRYNKMRGRTRNYGIAVTKAAYSGGNLPVDPYTLGYWLGDGTSKDASITTADPEVLTYIERAGYEIGAPSVKPDNLASTYTIHGLYRQLRLAGLLRNKHVPDVYLRASEKDRLALVQGLMDSDGYVSERGQCEFVNTSKCLIDALIELLCSLGIKASAPKVKKTLIGRPRWTVKFTTTVPVFELMRKLVRMPDSYRDAAFWYIDSIEPVDSVPVRCISVDSPDRTYLVTRHHIATHNSGIINEARPGEIADYNKNGLKISMHNGSIIQGYSAEKPDSVRGANLSYAWFDELAMIRYFKFYDYGLQPALRVGDCPRLMITTTPKRMKLIRKLIADAKIKPDIVHLTHATSDENPYISKMTKRLRGEYAGTYLERQELGGEFLDEVDGALFSYDMFAEHRVDDKEVPSLKRVIVSIDPATTSGEESDETGIVVAGLGEDNHVYILDDCSLKGSPTRCMEAAVGALEEFSADYIVGETNGVGDYMLNALRVVNPHVAFKAVRGMKGKFIRAVPASLYAAQGKVHMVGTDVAGVHRFEKLINQLCAMTEDDDRSSMHDDRADAFVWTILEFRDAWQGSMKEAYGFTTCNHCGADVHEKKDKRCRSCGHEVPPMVEITSDRPRGSRWSDAYYATCGKCGENYPSRENKCPHCFKPPEIYLQEVMALSGKNRTSFGVYTGKNWLAGRKL